MFEDIKKVIKVQTETALSVNEIKAAVLTKFSVTEPYIFANGTNGAHIEEDVLADWILQNINDSSFFIKIIKASTVEHEMKNLNTDQCNAQNLELVTPPNSQFNSCTPNYEILNISGLFSSEVSELIDQRLDHDLMDKNVRFLNTAILKLSILPWKIEKCVH